jgi:hypothetical protein
MFRNYQIKSIVSLSALATFMCASPSLAEPVDLLKKALVDDSKHYINFRYRLETVDQDGLAENATASTLRSALGYQTGSLYDFSGTIEFQNIAGLGAERYNDTINGKTQFPTVADPEQTVLNKLFLSYSGIPETVVSFGRQLYNFDNMRFVNDNEWRQQHQTYDSFSLVNNSLPDTTLNYVYTYKLNLSNGNDFATGNRDVDFHFLNGKYSGWKYGSVVGYAYLLDYDLASLSSMASQSYGLRFTGKAPVTEGINALYTAEYAIQSDYGNNTANYNADYFLGELGIGQEQWSVLLGYELVGADGTNGVFNTPLASIHAFHGWADKFATTPANGIEDKYIKAAYTVKSPEYAALDGLKFDLRYHQFDAEQGNADYGSEVDMQISKNFLKHYSAAVQFADYNADSFATDTQKIYIMLGAKF